MATNKQINPFINNLYVPYIEIVKSIHTVAGKPVVDSYEVEAQKYFRVYTSKAMREFLFQKLSMWGRDMFTAIQHFGLENERYLILSYDKINTLYGGNYSSRRYRETVKELISFSLIDIKDKDKNQYWYNPMYFSPNNRLTLFEECKVKIKTTYKSAS